ncbi:hypothetical protein EOD39_17469 [Acipenser ruthenus]|uniref:Uncharacterized protein n=1 Tax=Acipenser ruthenus TaxID=7906 RepID=A0A444V3C5_ACIRT|nr:hypothetical protein EOD39_17469 [Acipenser ruthenus]
MDRKPWSMKKDPEEALAGADMPPLLGWMPILEEIDFQEWLREQLAMLEEKRSRAVAGPTGKKTSIERMWRSIQGKLPTPRDAPSQWPDRPRPAPPSRPAQRYHSDPPVQTPHQQQ